MEKLTRAKLRGEPLFKDCYKAKHNFEGNIDTCLGLVEGDSKEVCDCCRECNDWFSNIDPKMIKRGN